MPTHVSSSFISLGTKVNLLYLSTLQTHELTLCQRCISLHPVGDALSTTSCSISCPCRHPPYTTDPRPHHLDLRGRMLLIGQLSPPSDCSLRLSGPASVATGCDTSLAAASCRIGKVEHQWWIGSRKGIVKRFPDALQVMIEANNVSTSTGCCSHT